MNTLQKEHDTKIKQYIIDCIDSEGYGVEVNTDKEKLQFLFDTFKSEYGHMISRIGHQKAFAEYCQGLPSCFNIVFMNYDIIELAKRIGTLPNLATDKQIDKILDNYWDYIANKTFQLFRKYNIV